MSMRLKVIAIGTASEAPSAPDHVVLMSFDRATDTIYATRLNPRARGGHA
jgi:hypothetical protein